MIKLENITISFNNKRVLNNFNLDIDKGDKILLNAPSGKGKTTILNLIMGYEMIQEGNITFMGMELNEKNIKKIRNQISYISQGVELQNIEVSLLAAEIFDFKYNKELSLDNNKLYELLTYFELPNEILKKNISQLSGGERQRLAFIIALLLNREVWIFDEITASLDSTLKEKVIKYISLSNKTVLAVSHDKVWEKSGIFKVINW